MAIWKSVVFPQAWEYGAHKDLWWEGTDEAFKSWDRAIEDSGLSWEQSPFLWKVDIGLGANHTTSVVG